MASTGPCGYSASSSRCVCSLILLLGQTDRIVVKSRDSGGHLPGFHYWLCHLLAKWPGMRYQAWMCLHRHLPLRAAVRIIQAIHKRHLVQSLPLIDAMYTLAILSSRLLLPCWLRWHGQAGMLEERGDML